MIRAANTGPIPGINLSSFSVAVLMSSWAGNNLSYLLGLGIGAARAGVTEIEGEALENGCVGRTCHIQWLPAHAPCSDFPSLRFVLQLFKSLAFGSGA